MSKLKQQIKAAKRYEENQAKKAGDISKIQKVKDRPKGMSKREFKAAKVGGILNYKTGKITIPKPVSKPAQTYTSRIESVQQDVNIVKQQDQNVVFKGGQGFSVAPEKQQQFLQQQQPPQKTQEQSLTEKIKGGIAKVSSFLGEQVGNIKWGVQHPLEVAKEVPGVVGRGAKELAIGTARLPFTIPAKVITSLEEPITGQKQYTPSSKIEKFIYGDEPITSYQEDQRQITKKAKELGLGNISSNLAGLVGAGGEVVLDLFPGTAGETKIGKQVLENIAKKKIGKEIEGELLKNGLKITKEGADLLTHVDKPEGVAATIKALEKKGLVEKVKPVSEINSAVIKSKEGKVYEGVSHADAISKAPKIEQPALLKTKEEKGLFKTKDGRLITRKQANKEFGITHSEEVPQLKKKQQIIKTEPISKKEGILTKAKREKELTYEPLIKTQKLAKGVKAKAIKEKLIYGFDKRFKDLPDYDVVKVKEQGNKAIDLIMNDYERSVRIAMGEEKPTGGLLPESVFTALENHAIENKDVEMLRRLATESNLTGEATVMGQRLRMLAERNPESAVSKITEVVNARKSAIEKGGTTVTKEKSKIVKEISESIKKVSPKKEDWSSFIESIKC